jgi:formylglycine-generating enzyme required for sulfatase activity
MASTGGPSKCLKPGDEFAECDKCPTMVVIPPGKFQMGSPESEEGRDSDEGPQHQVTIRTIFATGKFEVTRGEYEAFVEATGHKSGNSCYVFVNGKQVDRAGLSFKSSGIKQTDEHPVVCVSWSDAMAYVDWLSKKTGGIYRLLSEAEWEYAARAGSSSPYSFGYKVAQLCEYANTLDRTAKKTIRLPASYDSCSDGYAFTAPVGSFMANDFGLQDMHGNVWEIVEDCYHDTYYQAPDDGSAWKSGSCDEIALRGGSWANSRLGVRSAERGMQKPSARGYFVGFRVARTLSAP